MVGSYSSDWEKKAHMACVIFHKKYTHVSKCHIMQILPFDLEQTGQGQLSIGLVHFMLVSLHACDIANLLSSPTQTYHFLYRMDQTSCLSQAFVVLPNWLSQVRY